MEKGEDRNAIYVSFVFNGREIDGVDDFKRELEPMYGCHFEDKWLPSCSEGGESWLLLLISIPFAEFVKQFVQDVAIDAIKYAGKRFIWRPLKSALGKLRKANEKRFPLKLLSTTFKFEGMEIVIAGMTDTELNDISKIFTAIATNLKNISDSYCFPVCKIELPLEKVSETEQYDFDEYRSLNSSLTDCLWRITYCDGYHSIYDAKQRIIIDEN